MTLVASTTRPQKSRPTAPRQTAGGPFEDPVLFDQLLDDQRNRAALQAGDARQIRTRHRLPSPDQVQNDPAVDLSNHLARRALGSLGSISSNSVCSLQRKFPAIHFCTFSCR